MCPLCQRSAKGSTSAQQSRVASGPRLVLSSSTASCGFRGSIAPLGVRARLDDGQVLRITPSLDPEGRVSGPPLRLHARRGTAFTGSKVYGDGFVLTREEGEALIAADPRNGLVVKDYLIGDDLNSTPRGIAQRMVIDFRDWSLERAATFAGPMQIVEERSTPRSRPMEKNPQAARLSVAVRASPS